MNLAAILSIGYAAGLILFVTGSAAWFEFHRSMGRFQHFMAGDDFYFRTVVLGLVWPLGMPCATVVLLAQRRGRRLVAEEKERQRIDAIVEREMRLK